ncbi:unnamed protein product [Cochlearia groenlandica]
MSSNERDHRWFYYKHPSTYDLNSKIMLAAVVSLSAVILLVLTLHLYARFVLRRRRRELAFRGLPVAFRHPFQTPKRGLDPTVIASLPTFKVDDVARGGGSFECAVCLSVLEEGDTARDLPNCKHVFHVDCVDTWLATCSTCPVCRSEVVRPRQRLLEPEPREGPVGGDGIASPRAMPSPLLLDEVRMNVTAEAVGSSFSRLDSFKRILTKDKSSNRINTQHHNSCVDQERVAES